jgi:hypothetical protein
MKVAQSNSLKTVEKWGGEVKGRKESNKGSKSDQCIMYIYVKYHNVTPLYNIY